MKTITDFTIYANSPSWRMRNAILDRLKLIPPFNGPDMKPFRLVPNMEPVQDEQIPFLGVYLLPDEELTGLGRNNQGDPQFDTEVVLGFSYVILNNHTPEIEQMLDVGYHSIMKLLHQPGWHEWPAVNPPLPTKPEAMIEGITKVSRRNNYGNTSKGKAIAEMQMEWHVSMGRTFYQAIVLDDFGGVDFTVIYPQPLDANRQPIRAQWNVPTS